MTSIEALSIWFPLGAPQQSARMRLFCFHAAGGNALVFRDWQNEFPSYIQICPVQLPGHGTRLREQPFRRMRPLVEALEHALQPWLDEPFAVFGHSMGAAIGFEFAHRLRARYGLHPRYLFVAGRRAPQRPFPLPTHALPEPLFIEELRRLNGTPDEVLSNRELLALTIPLLRADFELSESCANVSRQPLDCPVMALGGSEDLEVTQEDLLAWREETTSEYCMRVISGGHFFVQTARSTVARLLVERLELVQDSVHHETSAGRV